jgi:hypothetical protein
MTSTDVPGRGLFGTVRQAMREARQAVAARHPPLNVTVVLPGAANGAPPGMIYSAVPPSGPASRAVAKAVAEVVVEHTRALGVPARPVVTVQSSTTGTAPRLFVAQRRARVPKAELDAALALRGGSFADKPSEDETVLAVTAATAARVAIEHDPSVLVGRLQREMLVVQAQTAGIREPAGHVLGAVLERVVAHGFKIGDLASLRAALDQQVGVVHTAAELAEVAIDALAEPSIEIRLNESTLRAATQRGMRRNAFVGMRQRLFSDLGLAFPDVAVTIDAAVPERAAVVRLNDVRGAPRPLPGEAGVVDIVRLLEQRLRAHPAWFVSLAETHRRIEDLELALPDLVAAVRERYGEPQLSLFARTFVEERVPVRNAARLMVLLLDAPPPSKGHDLVRLAEPSRQTDQRARPGARGLVAYTRQQMNEEAARSRPGVATVEQTRLPAELDAALTAVPLGDAGIDAQVDSAEFDNLMDLAERQLDVERRDDVDRRPLLTSTQRSRSVASRLLAWQYPEIVVLASEEYPPSHRLPPADPPSPPAPGAPAGNPRPGKGGTSAGDRTQLP